MAQVLPFLKNLTSLNKEPRLFFGRGLFHLEFFSASSLSLEDLFLTKLVRISGGFSSLFLAIPVLSAHLPESAKNAAIAKKREENPEILTNLVRRRLTRSNGGPGGQN